MSSVDAEASICGWVHEHLGGEVTSLERQPRWRPVWFATVERGGERLDLCVRGERVDMPGVFPLRQEMIAQELMHERGIPAPRVHGWIESPRGFVTDLVPGVSDFSGRTEAERDAVVDDYVRILAELHSLDPEPFAAAGIPRAPTPEQSGTVGMAAYLRMYRATKRRPDPFLEFCLGWLERNPLVNPGREAMIVWDSGQFHHRGGRVVAILDLELAHVGDPLMDLAALRMRDTVIGYGDPRRIYDRYAALTGTSVDLDAIRHHHFAFALSNQLAFHGALADPPPASDYMTNLQWCCETNLFAIEGLADILGITLEPLALPEPVVTPGAVAHQQLVSVLREPLGGDAFGTYRLRGAFRLARHLQRRDEIGAAVTDADLDDLAALLGRRPDGWAEGDLELERFVLDDRGCHDEELVHLFHRRLTRAHWLLGPPGSAMATHHAIRPLPVSRTA